MKVAELAQRFGLRPSEADAGIFHVYSDTSPDGDEYCGLDFIGEPLDPEKAEKYDRFAEALGIKGDQVRAPNLSGLEDLLDRALSLAPRPRAR